MKVEAGAERTPDGRGTFFWVRVVPGASCGTIVGWQEDGKLRVRVAAPPERGKANKALIELIARELGVRSSALKVVQGFTSREKRLEAEGVPLERIIGLGHTARSTRGEH